MNLIKRLLKPSRRPDRRILMVTRELVPFQYGGIGTHFKALAQYLVAEGHQVRFLSCRPQDFETRLYQQHYGEIQVRFVPTEGISGTASNYRYARRVQTAFEELYEQFRPHVVFCAEYGGEGFFLLLASRQGQYGQTRFIVTAQGGLQEAIGVYEGGEPRLSRSALDRDENKITVAMENLSLLLAEEVVAPTRIAWEEIRNRLTSVREARIIPNFASDQFMDWENRNPHAVRKRTILFVGRLDRHKGADILLKAYLELVREFPDAEHLPDLVFVGRDCMYREYKTTFMEYWENRIPEKLIRHITFAGQVPHHKVRKYLQQATVCVFPSRWEVFGIVCLEAMAAGCPVLVSKGTGLAEMLGERLAEWVVDTGAEGRELVDRLREILAEKDHRGQHAKLFHKRAKELRKKGQAEIRSLIASPSRTTGAPGEYTPDMETQMVSLMMASAREFDRDHA